MMQRLLPYLTHRLVAIPIVGLAIAMTLARLLLPMASDYRAEIEQAISDEIGKQVSIASISARWRWLTPQLSLHGIELSAKEANRPPLRLDEVRIGIAPFDTLINGSFTPRFVEVVNATIRLRKEADGGITMLGINEHQLINESTDGADKGFDLNRLPVGIGLVDSQLYLETTNLKKPLKLYNVNLAIRRNSNGFTLKSQLQVSGHRANQITASADITGRLDQPDNWKSDFYLSGQSLAIDSLLRHFVPSDFTQLTGLGQFEIWGSVDRGQLEELEGSLTLKQLAIERLLEARKKRYTVESMQGQFRWHRIDDGWRLDMNRLRFRRNNAQWPSAALSIKANNHQGKLQLIEGHMDFIRLQDIISTVEVMPAAGKGLIQAMQNLRPAGDIRAIRFTATLGGKETQWTASGRLERVRSRAWNDIPSTSNLTANFQANHLGGVASVNSSDILLSFSNGLFRNNLRVKRLLGILSWERASNGWRVRSDAVTLDTPDFKTRSRFTLQIPKSASPVLDMHTAIDYVDVAYIRNYLPVGIMMPRIKEWVDRSLVGGHIKSGTMVLRGPLDDFPFDVRKTGRFEAALNVEDVILDYQEGWPRLEDASAELRFINNSFEGTIHRADISASRVESAFARIDRLDPATALNMEGVVSGPLSDSLRLLTDSPLSKKFGEMASGIEGKGDNRIKIRLSEPLDSEDTSPSTVRGTISLNNNRLDIDKWDVYLSEIKGELNFDEKKVWAKGMKAVALNSPIVVDVISPKKGIRRTEIHAKSRYKVKTLADRYIELPLPHIKGNTNWHLKIDIPHESTGKPVVLSVASDLRGVDIALPPPLGKKPNTKQPLRISLNPDTDNGDMPVNIRIGDLADVYMSMARTSDGKRTMERSEVSFGGKKAKRPKTPGLHFKGRLSRFRLDPWIEMFGNGKGQSERPLMLREVDVDFGRFEYKALSFNKIHIKGRGIDGKWKGRVKSPELAGLIELPKDLKKGTIKLDLDYYSLNSEKGAKKNKKAQPNRLDPRLLPGFDVKSKKLIFNGQNLGALTIKALKKREGLFFDQVRVVSDWFKLNAKGSWFYKKVMPVSTAMFKAETKDLGRLLKAFNFAATIKKAPGRMEGNLSWPGDPTNINDLNISGKLALDFRKGSFVDFDPGAGRLFGLLNLGALQRRLTLDFSDIFGKGFGFDKIKGNFTLDNGDAFTSNLTINAPTGVIEVSGRTGLIRRDYDQKVNVIPDVTGTLATAGTLAAGPIVGAALFLTSKILGKQLNKVGKTRYVVKGPWDKPNITALKSKKQQNVKKQPAKPGFNLDDL